MSDCKIFHNVIKPIESESIAKSSDTTTTWLDVGGWVDKVIAVDADSSGTINLDVTLHVSSQGAYELNNKTATTEDYEAVSIVTGHSSADYTRFDSDDVSDLNKPMRSVRVLAENKDSSDATTLNLWVEGWS